MFDANFLTKMQEICTDRTHEVNGKTFSALSMKQILPREPDCVAFNTLQAFAQEAARIYARYPGIIIVDSPIQCSFVTDHDSDGRRSTLVKTMSHVTQFDFGRMLSLNDFLSGLREQFLDSDDRNNMLSALSNIVLEESITMENDGVAASITTKQGISRASTVQLHPFQKLTPYRTFVEVSQPESEFVLRLIKDGAKVYCELSDVDGGHWKLEAKKNIYDYIKKFSGDVPVLY